MKLSTLGNTWSLESAVEGEVVEEGERMRLV